MRANVGQARFEPWAATYEQSELQTLLFVPVHEAVLDQLRIFAPGAHRVLDVGCGTGRLLREGMHDCALSVGVDPSPGMLAAAHRLGTVSGLVCAVAEQLPFQSDSFDVVVSTLSLRHWRDARVGIDEMVRVLAPGGVLLIADADPHGRPASERRRLRVRNDPRAAWARAALGTSALELLDVRTVPVRGPVAPTYLATCRRGPARGRGDRVRATATNGDVNGRA